MKEKIEIFNIEVEALRNSEDTDCIFIHWDSNIGFGEYTLYKSKDEDTWHADSECMDKYNDKSFLMLLLRKFVEEVEVD